MTGLAISKGGCNAPVISLLICSTVFFGALPGIAFGQNLAGCASGISLELASVLAVSATPTVTPTPTSTPALPGGYVLYFDGGDYVDHGADEILNPTDEYTIEAWVKPDQTASDAVILSRDDTMAGVAYALWMTPEYYFYIVGPPSYTAILSVSPPEIDVWTHLAAVCDFGTVRLYRDGVLQGELSGTPPDQFAVATLIGALFESGTVVPQWHGWIDEVRFWDVARTGPEISQWMSQPLSGSPPGLVGYWNFDEGSGQVAHDSSPNSLDGILGGSLNPGDDDPTWVLPNGAPIPGPQDCDGNGVSDDVQIAASPELDCNANGILDLCETGGYASPPAEQDICELAQWICPGEEYPGTTIGAGNEGWITGSCGNADLAPDVWYLYRPGSDGDISIMLCNSGYDTVVAVYDGCPSQGGVQLVCDDDSCLHFWPEAGRSRIDSFTVEGGREYYIRVAGSGTVSGNFHIQILGPPCLSTDKNGNSVPDDCEPPVNCGPDVLCYDDGDSSADTFVSESGPASFLVKFSVPDTFTGLKQVAKITWYPGPYPIENPKAVVRGDLSGGFGTTQNCIIENIGTVVPDQFNVVDLGNNSKEFLVGAGDNFYAGVYGSRISIGADTAVQTAVGVRKGSRWQRGASACYPVYPPPPTVSSALTIPSWGQRNYRLNTAGTYDPLDAVSVTSWGPLICAYDTGVYSHFTVTHTYGSGYRTITTWTHYCDAFCSQRFLIMGQNWLIRATLAGTLSPELVGGCYDRVAQPDTPTPAPTLPTGIDRNLWIFR